jgi:hypothetical protein
LLMVGALPLAGQQAPNPKAFFKDTGSAGNGLGTVPGVRTFDLRAPGQRDSLRATLRKERELWRAGGVRDYLFLLRVACFCPRPRGWLLIDVRSGQPLRAWDKAGEAAPIVDWNTFSIEVLFDNMLRSADVDRLVKIAFDPRRHFPTYVYAVGIPGPDVWVIIEARGLRRVGAASTTPEPARRSNHLRP